MKSIIYSVLLLLILSSCTEEPSNVSIINEPAPIFPDYAGVTVPVDIAPLNFNVIAEGTELVSVNIHGENGENMRVNGKYAKFDIDQWHSLLSKNKGAQLTVSVQAKIKGKWYLYDSFNIHVSQYPLDEWGVTYRRIAPSYEVYSLLGLYQRNLTNFEESVIIDNKNTRGMCLNCHTSNQTNPSQFVFHVRGEHGATMIQQDGSREWLQSSNGTLGGSMVYPYWHPSGDYCAFSTNRTNQGFHIGMSKRIEVFDYSSDVFVYNTKTHEILMDSLLSSTQYAENCPVFSPDGKKLYFISSYQQDYPSDFKSQRYNLCSIDFNPADGTFGNKVDTLFNAAARGKSLTWPKPSYDGRFLLFTLIDYGYFSIWHKESEQWLMDLETGEAHPITEINSKDADSYHNWNSNSRWIVFTSRRDNGLYSQLFIASIDENGKATKPFLLPQKNPLEYYDETFYSFNTPDFTQEKVTFDAKSAFKEIVSDVRTSTHVK